MNKVSCLRLYVQLVSISLVVAISSCQKEGSIEIAPPPAIKDTIASVVIDGDLGGLSLVDYDSMVLQYTAGKTTISHYERNKTLLAIETLQYDGSNRVIKYGATEPTNAAYFSRKFTYSGMESIPSVIDDTSGTVVNDILISKVRVTGRSAASNTNTLNLAADFKYVANPVFNFSTTANSTFDNSGRLLSFSNPDGYRNNYHFNAAGDPDSVIALSPGGGDDTYARLWYTAEQNPLKEFANFLYKNLAVYSVEDKLNSSYYENLLNVANFPSELLGSKIPLKTMYGFDASQLQDEYTYLYTIDNSVVKQIRVTYKDLFSGDVSQTYIRFHIK